MQGTETNDDNKKRLREVSNFKERLISLGYSEETAEVVINHTEKKGLWHNIHQKRKRIKAGSGERMRKPGSKGAPSAKDLKAAAKDEKFGERKRPDYPDVDNDNNRKETMESAVKNAKMKRKKATKAGIKID